ncbi:uncharacterized protein BO97DRAFT_151204 [Aspergillus homomorphus CBS 101889]|uniref:Uncharacterized protein n=1 Tax=Aspergillus homomorphus (strain CBS 101889) TaxID=1450537 RepID=A0A395HQ52_ASPHC|nr:hypothetical protein BO97DRAFT_151204 [Aspergillus homomorphus CBS 101889]RAL09947.1 hypothetical protein BO97DRAFT_151204 [Aspergillus homomorphus CBS 101889]
MTRDSREMKAKDLQRRIRGGSMRPSGIPWHAIGSDRNKLTWRSHWERKSFPIYRFPTYNYRVLLHLGEVDGLLNATRRAGPDRGVIAVFVETDGCLATLGVYAVWVIHEETAVVILSE